MQLLVGPSQTADMKTVARCQERITRRQAVMEADMSTWGTSRAAEVMRFNNEHNLPLEI